MITLKDGDLTLEGTADELIAEAVAVLAAVYQHHMIPNCGKEGAKIRLGRLTKLITSGRGSALVERMDVD